VNTYVVSKKALTIAGITASNKTYNGNTTATIDVSAATFAELETGDLVTVSASGTFDNKNVGTGKTVTLSVTNAGADVANYTITNQSSTTANITQLSSVTWNGNAGDGLWSSASNWAGSAIPDQNNVAAVVIPSAQSVTFDSDTVGTIGSTITNNGTLTFNGATDYTFGQVISGSGALVKTNTNTLTLSATNTYSGNTTISAGTIKLTGNVSASTDLSIASGATLDLQSTQTFATLDLNGTILNSAGSSALTITGTSDIGGSITTTGSQTYTGDVTISADISLNTSGGNITFDGDINTAVESSASESAIIQFLGLGSYKLSMDGGSTYTTATATSSATAIGTGSLTYDSGSYSWTTPDSIDSTKLLVVAGGGGGGSSRNIADNNGVAGGGGAGGLIYNESYSISASTSYTITVGAGGAGGAGNTSSGANGTQGGNSVFNDQTAIGGGYGAIGNDTGATGGTGGSGGGGGNDGSGSNGGSGTVDKEMREDQ
jgi:autotransporter-associated beta strand protein